MFQKSFGVELFSGSSLNAIHKENSSVKFYRFLNGNVAEITTTEVPFLDSKVKTTAPALSDGYYMVVSSGEEMFFAKGNLGRMAFIRYKMDTQLPSIPVTRIDIDGNDIEVATAGLVIGEIYALSIPSSDPEILHIEDVFIACEPLVSFNQTNVYQSNNKTRLTSNPIKTDIISKDLLSRVRREKLTARIRHTSFRSE